MIVNASDLHLDPKWVIDTHTFGQNLPLFAVSLSAASALKGTSTALRIPPPFHNGSGISKRLKGFILAYSSVRYHWQAILISITFFSKPCFFFMIRSVKQPIAFAAVGRQAGAALLCQAELRLRISKTVSSMLRWVVLRMIQPA